MDEQLGFLLEIGRRLDSAAIPYMITGSVALSAYAAPRMTRDIDIVVEIGLDDVDRIVGLFEQDCYIDRDAVSRAIHDCGIFNVIHDETIIKADFIVRRNEPFRIAEFERRRLLSIAGRQIAFVTPEDLILAKLCWSRESRSEIQERDVASLLASVNDLDLEYLRSWSARLGVAAALESLQRK